MPEGPQVHLVARNHGEWFARKKVRIDSPDGRSDDVAAVIDGRIVRRVDAVGKHLFYVFAADVQLHVHLGRFGGFAAGPMPLLEPKGMLRFRIWTAKRWVELRGAIAIELLDRERRAAIEARLGPDPLNDDDPSAGFERIRKSRAPIGTLLMDQAILAGIGNIYRAEILFRHRVSPFRIGSTMDRPTLDAMWLDLDRIMRDNMDRGGRIVTTDPADRRSKAARIQRDDRFYVYHRQGKPCRRCGAAIERRPMGARTIYWCPACQPLPDAELRTTAGPTVKRVRPAPTPQEPEAKAVPAPRPSRGRRARAE